MRLFYVSPRDVRKNRADPVHIMKSCAEFARNGFDVTLITPRVKRNENVPLESVWELYGIEKTFRIIELPTFLSDDSWPLTARLKKFFAFLLFFLYQFGLRRNRDVLVYSKCYISTIPLILLKKILLVRVSFFFETASFKKGKRSHAFIARNAEGIVLFNDYIIQRYMNEYGIPRESIHKAGFPSQIDDFPKEWTEKKLEFRKKFGLPADKMIVMYAGKFSTESREIDYIVGCAAKKRDIEFVLVGSKEVSDLHYGAKLKQKGITNVKLFRHQPVTHFFQYLCSADILLSYYDSGDEISIYQRTPAKLGLYFISKRPVILADLPSMREIANDDMVFFVPPNDIGALAKTISWVAQNPMEAERRALNAFRFAKKNSYRDSYMGVTGFLKRSVLFQSENHRWIESP